MKTIAIAIPLKYKNQEDAFAAGIGGKPKLDRVLELLEAIASTSTKGSEINFIRILSVSTDEPLETRAELFSKLDQRIRQWQERNKHVVCVHRPVHASNREPATLYLWQLWDFCFSELKCEAVLHIDPQMARDDLSDASRQRLVAGLSLLLRRPSHMRLGDYRPIVSAGLTQLKDVHGKIQIEAE